MIQVLDQAVQAGATCSMYTLPSLMDDLTLKASYSPGGAGGEGATSIPYGGFTGIEVLNRFICWLW